MTKSLELYHPQEHTIISAWLNRKPPEGAPDLSDLAYYVEEPAGPVGLRLNADGDEDEDTAIENAVARLALEHIEKRLPQWAACYADGRVETGRKYRNNSDKPDRTVNLLPQLICEINWANSGPGYSWPEAYHVTWLPLYDVYVVTASQDSPDVHGYTEEAIAHFTKDKPFKKSVFRAIQELWSSNAACGQGRWENFFYEGLISAHQAERIADTVDWEEEY